MITQNIKITVTASKANINNEPYPKVNFDRIENKFINSAQIIHTDIFIFNLLRAYMYYIIYRHLCLLFMRYKKVHIALTLNISHMYISMQYLYKKYCLKKIIWDFIFISIIIIQRLLM